MRVRINRATLLALLLNLSWANCWPIVGMLFMLFLLFTPHTNEDVGGKERWLMLMTSQLSEVNLFVPACLLYIRRGQCEVRGNFIDFLQLTAKRFSSSKG